MKPIEKPSRPDGLPAARVLELRPFGTSNCCPSNLRNLSITFFWSRTSDFAQSSTPPTATQVLKNQPHRPIDSGTKRLQASKHAARWLTNVDG